jgi:hypothetical protein
MSSESVCQAARSWVNVGSFHTSLYGVVYGTCDDFHNGSKKGTASVHQILCKSWENCYEDPHNDSTNLRGPILPPSGKAAHHQGHFAAMGGLVWSTDPQSHAGGTLATGRASLSGQVDDDNPDDQRHPPTPRCCVDCLNPC